MVIPRKIKIGGLIYKVSLHTEKDLNDCVGEMDSLDLTIKLRKGEKTAMELTLIHEILHAINNEVRETDIEYMAQALYQIIRDNPALFVGGEKYGKK